MTLQRIKGLYEDRPFRPFTILFKDGRKIKVQYPECLGFFPGGKSIIVTHADDSFTLIQLISVADLKVEPNVKSGRKRSRVREP